MNPQRSTSPLFFSAASLVAFLVLLFIAWLIIHTLEHDPDGSYRPRGFYERAASLIRDEALVLQAPTDATKSPSDPSAPPAWGAIIITDQAKKEPHKSFLAESRRMRQDIQQFNQYGPGGLFNIKDNSLILNTYAHNFQLPYPEKQNWTGSLSFRGDLLPTLAGENLMLAFISTEEDSIAGAQEHVVLTFNQWLGAVPASRRTWRAKAYDLLSGNGTGGFLRLYVDGEKVTIEVAENQTGGSVYINGIPLNQGEVDGLSELRERSKQDKPNRYQLMPGDRVRVVSKGREAVFRFGKFAGGMISRSWLEEGREINEVDPQLAKEIPYVAQLHTALQAYVKQNKDAGKLNQPNVQLSFDRGLHINLSRRLDEYLKVFDSTKSTVREISRQPACITVMDALTGDVIAMPSYPSPQRIEELDQLARNGKMSPISAVEKGRLAKNQNLLPVVIGSTTKPLLACAVWEAYPELRQLVVDEPAGSMNVVAGYKLSTGIATKGPRTINPVSFLEKSSNAYTVSLYFATLADPGTWKIGKDGRLQPTSPQGITYLTNIKNDIIAGGLGHRRNPANDKLGELFDISLRGDYTKPQNAELDESLLRPMYQQMNITDPIVHESFRSVSSTVPNLALQTVDTVRGELVSLLVGGYTNRWPNVKLAEAYARIGTGKKVNMRVTLPHQEKKAPDFPAMDISHEVLATVHQGMEAAVKTGTAARLAPALRAEQARFAKMGLDFRLIGKTGTARRTDHTECAAFCFYAEILPKGKGAPLAAVSTAIYLQDRAAARGIENSAVAVELASSLLPDITSWLEAQPAVREWSTKN